MTWQAYAAWRKRISCAHKQHSSAYSRSQHYGKQQNQLQPTAMCRHEKAGMLLASKGVEPAVNISGDGRRQPDWQQWWQSLFNVKPSTMRENQAAGAYQ